MGGWVSRGYYILRGSLKNLIRVGQKGDMKGVIICDAKGRVSRALVVHDCRYRLEHAGFESSFVIPASGPFKSLGATSR